MYIMLHYYTQIIEYPKFQKKAKTPQKMLKKSHPPPQPPHQQSHKPPKQPPCKVLKQYMTSVPYTLFLSALTIYTIFAIDIDKGFFSQDASVVFSAVHVVSIGIFVFEVVVLSFVDRGYFLGFYFWVDVFSTLTMFLEIIWIQNLMSSPDNIQVAVSFTKVSKASRFSKIGARSTKILKLIRLIKLFKFVRKDENKQEYHNQSIRQQSVLKQQGDLFAQQQPQKNSQKQVQMKSQPNNQLQNQTQKQKQSQNYSQTKQLALVSKETAIKFDRPNVNKKLQQEIQMKWQLQSLEMHQSLEVMNQTQEKERGTKVGQKLNYQIQKNLVIMVMGLIMIMPILNADTWFNKTTDLKTFFPTCIDIFTNQQNNTKLQTWLNSIVQNSQNSVEPILALKYSKTIKNTTSAQLETYFYNYIYEGKNDVNQLRPSQKSIIESNNETSYQVVFSKRQEVRITSWTNIGRSFFVIVLLLFASIFFIKDLETYALFPLQKMNNTVEKIDRDPFSALDADEQNEDQQLTNHSQQKQQEMDLQTTILQKFFIKITGLLALGIGQTPFKSLSVQHQQQTKSIKNTVKHNLNQNQNQCIFSDCQPVQIAGIFVCIQVAHFDQIVEKFEEKSLSYVNNIIQIFHQVVVQNGAFILHQDQTYSFVYWKFSEKYDQQPQKSAEYKLQQKKQAQLLFMSYVKFYERISQDPKMREFQQQLSQIITDYKKYKIHIGINPGVAYCAPIGSQFKLSLKAMGQDITIAKGLCQAAKSYKLQNLYSGKFSKISPFLQNLSRRIQNLQFMSNQFQIQRLPVYSTYITSQFRNNNRTQNQITLHHQQEAQDEYKQRRKIKTIFKLRQNLMLNNCKYKPEQVANFCRNFLRKNKNIEEWIMLWKETMEFYDQGQWGAAKVGFENARDCSPYEEDYPTELKIREIQGREQPPIGWANRKTIYLCF